MVFFFCYSGRDVLNLERRHEMGNRVLIIGEGGREDAIAWKLKQSRNVGEIYSRREGNFPVESFDIEGMALFAERERIDLTFVGPEVPLSLGIVNIFRNMGLKIFGPTKQATEIESSKASAKQLMAESKVPTANFKVFTSYRQARDYIGKKPLPSVIKASGLAGGKGAYVCKTLLEANQALSAIMRDRVHGSAGEKVVIEDFLVGEEASLHAVCDGRTSLVFPASQDYKRLFNNDKGPNTGGMGAIAPLPGISEAFLNETKKRTVWPILGALARHDRSFTGLLYPGLMLTKAGPMVLEYNARFGDPETEVYMRNLKSDLFELLLASADGKLSEYKIEWHPGFAVCVVLAGKDYPAPIYGVKEAEEVPGVKVFRCGVKATNGRLETSGGRVLAVTARGASLKEAIWRVYVAIKFIRFEGMHYRRDIGARALSRR